MEIDPQQLRRLLDRDGILACLARLARGEDRRDAALISTAFWPDARTDYGVFAGSFDDYLAWVVPGADAVAATQHILGQSLVEIAGDGARVETHVLGYHRVDMASTVRDTCIGGRYLDRFERRGDDWRIAERTMLYDWVQDWGEAIDWSQGLMGTPFSAGHYSARTKGDWSEMFFAATSE